MRKNDTIEILSPAKNYTYAKEAILCGADAVYMGAPLFSLRHEHNNSLEDIKKTVEFAHKYWAKVYVPLNCLLYSDDDLNKAQNLINELYKLDVDGLIIQDIGILELDIPKIPIILSTNTMCFTKEKISFFEHCKVDRIVLPRELSYEEIKDIAKNTNIPLEIFCYGFLCVGHSGNCYLAYCENLNKTKTNKIAHYNASNHGVCPERCMGHWNLIDKDGNVIIENDRLFNLRFLSLHNEIEKLYELGIDSFKIAGREKDLKHVKNSTAFFSQIANNLLKSKNIKRSSSGRTILSFEPDLYKNFNKGFTDFFLNKRKKEMYSKYDIVGKYIGKVINFNNNSFELDTDFELNKGDKLRYKKGNNEVRTIEIINVKDNRYFINKINDNISDLELYRYIDKKGFDEVENSINYRVISTSLKINEIDNGYEITALDEDDNKIKLKINKGNKKILNKDIKNSFYNLDIDCEFIIDEVDFNKDLFIDDINLTRNEIFESLRNTRKINRKKDISDLQKSNYPYYKEELSYLDNVTNKKAREFYKRHGVKKIEQPLENTDNLKGKKVFTSSYCLRYELGYCSKQNPDKKANTPWKLKQIESNLNYKAEFDCKNCKMYLYLDD